jgi:hypothetical protein
MGARRQRPSLRQSWQLDLPHTHFNDPQFHAEPQPTTPGPERPQRVHLDLTQKQIDGMVQTVSSLKNPQLVSYVIMQKVKGGKIQKQLQLVLKQGLFFVFLLLYTSNAQA